MASGDTLELTIAHSVVGSRPFAVQSNQDISLDKGGYSATRAANGNLTGHKQLNAKPWMIEGIQIEFDPDDGAIEFLQSISDSPIDATITWQHINGVVYTGKGSIEGDLKANTNTGYIAITLSGNKRLDKIA